jgi:hypothetical protein
MLAVHDGEGEETGLTDSSVSAFAFLRTFGFFSSSKGFLRFLEDALRGGGFMLWDPLIEVKVLFCSVRKPGCGGRVLDWRAWGMIFGKSCLTQTPLAEEWQAVAADSLAWKLESEFGAVGAEAGGMRGRIAAISRPVVGM